MAKYKVGDKVTIRQWEDMEKEYGLTPERNIRTEVTFVKNMKYMCGNTYKVNEVTGSGNYFVDGWIVSDQMIAPKVEKQMLVIYRRVKGWGKKKNPQELSDITRTWKLPWNAF